MARRFTGMTGAGRAALVAAILSAGPAIAAAAPRDEKIDLVATDRDGLWVFLGQGDGTFDDGEFYYVGDGVECWHVIAPDLDGDGRSDIVSADRYGGGISVLLAKGDGTLLAPASAAFDSMSARTRSMSPEALRTRRRTRPRDERSSKMTTRIRRWPTIEMWMLSLRPS